MDSLESVRPPNLLRQRRVPIRVAFTIATLMLICAHRSETCKSNPGSSTVLQADWMFAPTISADFAASPAVTTPTASVAGFSVCPLPVVAAVVDVVRLHEVTTSRIGGLYGP